MTTVRLTNRDRGAIVDGALETAFKERGAAVPAAEDALARRCYEAVFPAAVRKAAAAVPKGWLRTDSCLRFNVGGMSVNLELQGHGLPVPYEGGYYQRLGSVSDPELVRAVTEHLTAVEAINNDRAKARASLNAVVYNVKTVKALRELWPEGEPFFGPLEAKPGAPGLPVPQITELNALLGLKTESTDEHA